MQVGSKEQQTSHSQRFLILFLRFFWMVHARGHCSSLSPSLALLFLCRLIVTSKSQHICKRLTDVHTRKNTDRATYPRYIQEHKHNVQMHSVTQSSTPTVIIIITTAMEHRTWAGSVVVAWVLLQPLCVNCACFDKYNDRVFMTLRLRRESPGVFG